MASNSEICTDKRASSGFGLRQVTARSSPAVRRYESKASAQNGIASVQKNAASATVVDLTESPYGDIRPAPPNGDGPTRIIPLCGAGWR